MNEIGEGRPGRVAPYFSDSGISSVPTEIGFLAQIGVSPTRVPKIPSLVATDSLPDPNLGLVSEIDSLIDDEERNLFRKVGGGGAGGIYCLGFLTYKYFNKYESDHFFSRQDVAREMLLNNASLVIAVTGLVCLVRIPKSLNKIDKLESLKRSVVDLETSNAYLTEELSNKQKRIGNLIGHCQDLYFRITGHR